MCRHCVPKKGESASYDHAAEGCLTLAKLLNGGPYPAEKRQGDTTKALEHIQNFVNFEILENGAIVPDHWRHQILKMFNIYLVRTQRQGAHERPELVPTAQELVDMLEACRENLASKVPLDPYQAKEFARRFQVLGEQIKQLD